MYPTDTKFAALTMSLWPACVRSLSFREQLAAASAAGFDRLPISGLTVRQLQGEGLGYGDIRQLAADYGVTLGHYDGFSDWASQRFSPHLIDAAKAVFDFSADECLEICDQLELDAICATGVFEAGRYSYQQQADSFAGFCERARPLGIRVELEFIPMWSVPNLGDAWEVVRLAGADNGSMLLDTWHFCRGDADMELLESLPAGAVTTIQLADAPRERGNVSLLEECLTSRRLPGEGELPLVAILDLIVAKGGVLDVGVEVFSDYLDGLSGNEAALRAATAMASLQGEWPPNNRLRH